MPLSPVSSARGRYSRALPKAVRSAWAPLLLPASAADRLPTGTSAEMFLRPEHVTLYGDSAPSTALPACIRELTFYGSLTRIKLTLSESEESEIWADLPSEAVEGFAPGKTVWAGWPPESPRVLPLH